MKHSTFFKTLSIFIFLAVFAAFFPATPAQAARCIDTHKVKSGDTVYSIAEQYKVDWRKLVRVNDIADANAKLKVGTILCIPAPSGKTKGTFTPSGTGVNSSGYTFTYVTTKGKELIFQTQNMPAKSSYFIRVGPVNATGSQWQKVGSVVKSGAKGGVITFKFILPDALKNQPRISVCLKNIATDHVRCITMKNPQYK
jgi:LysM repeat protein